MSKRRVNMKLLSFHFSRHLPAITSRAHTHTHTFSSFFSCIYCGMQFHITLLFVFSLFAKYSEMYEVMMIYDFHRTKKIEIEKKTIERLRDRTLSFVACLLLENKYTCIWLKNLIVWAFCTLCAPIRRCMHTYKYKTQQTCTLYNMDTHRLVYSNNSNKELPHFFFMLHMNI